MRNPTVHQGTDFCIVAVKEPASAFVYQDESLNAENYNDDRVFSIITPLLD